MKDPDHIQCRLCSEWFQNLTFHLSSVHECTVEEYKAEFGVDHVQSDTLREASSGKDGYRARSREEVVERLHELASERHPLTYNYVEWKDPSVLSQLTHIFGTWKKAMAACGIEHTAIEKWSPEKVVAEILVIRDRDGVGALERQKVDSGWRGLVRAADSHWGSWKEALIAAGIDPFSTGTKFHRTDEELEDALRAWSDRHGAVSSTKLQDTDTSLANSLRKRFGSIRKLVIRLGLPDASQRQLWTEKVTVGRLRKWSKEHGVLNRSALRKTNSALERAIDQHFSSLQEAADAAGVNYKPAGYGRAGRASHRTWTRRKMAGELQKWSKEKAIRPADLQKGYPKLHSALTRSFGTIPKACKELGFEYELLQKKWTDEEVEAGIKSVFAETGTISKRTLNDFSKGLSKAAVRRYGSIAEVAEAFNIPYRKQVRWTYEKIRAAFEELHLEGTRLTLPNVAARFGYGMTTTAASRYGSYDNALKICGFARANKERDLTAVDLKIALEEWMTEHGEFHAKKLRQTDQTLYHILNKRYGLIRKAAQALNLPYHETKPLWKQWTRAKIRRQFREWSETGTKVTVKTLPLEHPSAFVHACRHYFGSYKAARKNACDPQ